MMFFFRPACAPLHSNQYQHSPLSSSNLSAWGNAGTTTNSHHLYNSSQYNQQKGHHTIRDADGNIIRKEKRQYRKRKHKLQKEKGLQSSGGLMGMGSSGHGGSGSGLGYSMSGHHMHHLSGESIAFIISFSLLFHFQFVSQRDFLYFLFTILLQSLPFHFSFVLQRFFS